MRIKNENDLTECVEHYGILRFWDETRLAASTLSDISFMKLWNVRERAVNSERVAYGKFVLKKAAFVALDVLPYLVSLRRNGYDFDSLCDEGLAPNREAIVMNADGDKPTPSYALGGALGIKGYDTAVASLQNKTYLALTFKKSSMGTALLCRPEDIWGADFVRSKYDLTPEQCAQKILERCKGLEDFTEKELKKILSPAV